MYDRKNGVLADLGATLWVDEFTDDGLLATDPFGPKSLIDLDALKYQTVLSGGEPQWSPDWRYASVGRALGHGGYCL